MHKLCSLKEIAPGSTVVLPKFYQSRDDEIGVLLGLHYDASKKHLYPAFGKRTGETIQLVPAGAMGEDEALMIAEDKSLMEATVAAFQAQGLVLGNGMQPTVGCDPEIFVEHGDGTVFPAWEFMPSEDDAKDVAHWTVPKAYWDGAQAEFAPAAGNCLDGLQRRIRAGLNVVLQNARKIDSEAKLSLRSVIELPEQVVKTADPKFIQFRCSRSYNIYNDCGDEVPDAREYRWRCTGGHIHLGPKMSFTAPGIERIIQGMDRVLAVAAVSMAAGIDDPERRKMYGRAGEFRLPSHGIEYRVLSNFWLTHPAVTMLTLELSRSILKLAQSGMLELAWTATNERTREVINNCDVQGARQILTDNLATLTEIVRRTWDNGVRTRDRVEAMTKVAIKTIFEGVGTIAKNPNDIEGNWKLGALSAYLPQRTWSIVSRKLVC